MYKNLFVIFFLLFQTAIADAAKQPEQTSYKVDIEHSSMGFEVAHLVISTVSGRFNEFSGEVTLDAKKDSVVAISGEVSAKSINTNQEKRDKHLRSPDFFDVEKYPVLKFTADNLNFKKGKKIKAKGKLTIRDIVKEIPIEFIYKGQVKDPWGTEKIVIDAFAEINRKDFGLTWNETLETGGVLVGDKIRLIVNVQANLANKN